MIDTAGIKTSKHINYLLIEHNQDDIIFIQKVFKKSKTLSNLSVVNNMAEAMDFLYKRGAYVNVFRPNIILLDINLPKKSGDKILEKVKNDDNFKDIPIIILATSEDEDTILKSYKLHANCYIVKPLVFDKFVKVISTIETFFCSIVTLPERSKYENDF